MAQRLPVQRINTGPQALRHAQRKLKLPTYVLANPRSSSLTDTFGGVAYLATGAGISHQAAPSGSWTDFIPATTNCAVVWMSAMPGSNDVATVTIGGVNAPAVSGNPFVYDATSGYNELQCFVLMNPPTGSKTVTVTFAGTNYFHATVVYYSGVGSVGSPTFVTGAAGTQPSMTVTSTLGKFYAQAFAYRPTDGNSTFTDHSGAKQRALFGNPGVGYSRPLTVGDVAGTGADTTISATRNSTSYPWGGVLLPLASTPDPAKWANWGAAVISDGKLATTPASAYNSGVTSNNPYDLTGSSVSIQLLQPPNVGTGSIETGFHIACASEALKHSFLLSNGNRGHFSDDFNRADGAIGAAWSAAGSPAPVISGNQFVAPTQGQWSGANSNNYATTTDHQVAVRIGTITADTTQIQLNVRVGPGNMMMSWWDGSAPTFSYNPGNVTVATGPVANFRTGDIITFAALGNVYTLYVNGGVVMTWTDTDTVFAYDNTYTGTLIGVQSNGANNCGFDDFWFDDIGRDLSFQTTVNGVVSTLASVNYDPVNHDFLRFREAGGTVYYETSEDGNAWDAQTSTPAVFSVSSSYIQIYAGYWGTETAPGVALWDNLNLPVPNPVYMPIKPVSRKTGPMALRQVIRQRPRAGPRPTTSPRIKVAAFTESFDTLDQWMTMSGSPSVANGLLTLPCASTYSTIMSIQSFDLNESSVYINLDQTQAAGNGTTDTIFAVMSCCGHLAQFVVANGQLITSDTASGYTSTRAYNAVAHQYLRIRATGNGTLYWESSPDASTWIQVATKAGSSFAAGNVQVYLSCGYDGVETNPLPAVFDGINLRPDWPNTRTTVKPVGRKVGPMALRQSRNLRRQQPYPRDIEGIYTADADLDVTVELTAEATVDTFIGASLATTASPVDDVDFSPALLDVAQTITVPGMEQATVTYDATGAGANSGATTVTSLSWSHTATAGADVFAFVLRGGGVTTATYDGAAMDYVGTVSLNNDANNGMLWVFRKSNVAAGTKTVAITFGTATYCSANSVSYLNVGAVTTSGAYAGAALTASQTITGATKSIVVNAIGQYCGGVDTFVSSSGGTQRYQGMGSAKYMNLVVQDTDSTGSTVFSSTVTATTTVSGSIGLLLSPTPATTAGVRTVQMLSSAKSNSTTPVGSISWSHNIESDATLLVVGISWLSNNWANPPVCTVNGLTMTRAYAGTWGGAYTGAIEYHYYVNPPSGTQNIVYTGNGNGAHLNVVSLTFKGTKSVGSTSYVANTTSLAVSAVGANDFLFNVWGSWVNGWAGFTGYNQTVLYDEPAGEPAVFGCSKGPATFSINSLVSNYGGYGTAVLPIKPQTDYLIDANLAVTVTNMPARPSVNGPYVDSIGAGGIGTSLSFTHTVGSRANLLLVAINNATYNSGPPAIYCDGVAMTQVAAWNYGYVHLYNYSHLTWYALWNPTPGTRTITSGGAGTVSGTSIAIANAGGIGSVTNSGTNPSVTGLPDQLMLNMFGGWPTGGGQNYTGYTPAASLLWDSAVATGNDGLPTVIGDWMDPSGTTTFSAVNHCGYATGGQILPIGVARQANTSVNVTATTTASASVNAVVYDSTGAGAASLNTVHSWSHTIASDANCVVVVIGHDGGASPTFSGTVGSTSMTYLGSGYEGSDGTNQYYAAMLVCMNPPTGNQTITITGTNGYNAMNSVSYKNVAGYTSFTTATGPGTTTKYQALSTGAGQMLVGGFQAYTGALSNFYPNQRWIYNYQSGIAVSMAMGDGGGVTAGFGVTDSSASGSGSVALVLLPAVPIKASLAATATLTADITVISGQHYDVDSSLAVTVTETQAASRVANVDAAQVVTATITATETRNQFATSSLATTATVTDTGYFFPAWTDTSQVITATLTSTGTRNAIVDSSLAETASLTSGDKTNQVFTANQTTTATADSTATRNAIVNASLAVNATITDIALRNANVDSASQAITATQIDVINWSAHAGTALSITSTLSDTATRNAIVDAARALTATATSAFWQGQRLNAITTAATFTITASETEAATGATPLAITAAPTADITKNQPLNTSLSVTASMTAEMTKNLFLDADLTTWAGETFPYILPILLGSPTADLFLVKGFFITSVFTVSLDGTIVRNVGVSAALVITTSSTATLRWAAHADLFTLAITATPTAAATRSLSIDAALAVIASAEIIPSTSHPADSSLSVTAVVSSTANVDFLIDAPKQITASLTSTGKRGQYLDAPLPVTATITDIVKWAAKFQASLAVTANRDITGTRNAIVNAPLGVTATRDQYLFQTEQFDVLLVTTAGLYVLFTINLYGDADLAVTATPLVEMTRISYAAAALDISTDLPLEATRDQYVEANLDVQDSTESAVNWDSLAEATLVATAEIPALLNQGFLVSVFLDVAAETPTEMLLEALLDALLLAESLALTAEGIRDQYAEALQQIMFSTTDETQWNIKMEAVLVVPVSVLADGGSAPISSNFFVFYL